MFFTVFKPKEGNDSKRHIRCTEQVEDAVVQSLSEILATVTYLVRNLRSAHRTLSPIKHRQQKQQYEYQRLLHISKVVWLY